MNGAFRKQALHFDQESEKHSSPAIINNSETKQTKGIAQHFHLNIANQENSAWGFNGGSNCPHRRWTNSLQLIWMAHLHHCSQWRQSSTDIWTIFYCLAFPTNKLQGWLYSSIAASYQTSWERVSERHNQFQKYIHISGPICFFTRCRMAFASWIWTMIQITWSMHMLSIYMYTLYIHIYILLKYFYTFEKR